MYRVGLIGCGAVAESGHVPTLLRHSRFSVAAVCDTREQRAALLAAQAGGVPMYTDWRELLDRERIDAAVLALPPEISPDIAIDCLERGLPVFNEKPLASSVQDGLRVARAVERTGGTYQIGFVFRYGAWVREIGELARAIGVPARTHVAIYDERLDPANVEHLTRIEGFIRNSSAMTHEGSHVVDYAGLWNPSPWKRVRATAERSLPTLPGPNLWRAEVQLADESVLEIEIGWLLPELPPCGVSIEGPNGRLELNPVTGAGWRRIANHETTLALPPMTPEWDRQYDAFAAAIEGTAPVPATVQHGMRALEITVACEESARTGEAVIQS